MTRRPARSLLEAACPLRLIDGEPVEPLRFIPVSQATHTNPLTNKVAPVVKQVAR